TGARAALATEGGTSHYIQGSYGDFLMGFFPGEGLAVRNDTIYMAQSLKQILKGGMVYAELNAFTTINLTKFSYMVDSPATGGMLGLAGGVPVILNTNVGGSINIRDPRNRRFDFSKSGDGNRGGLSDLFLGPVAAWNFGECHLALMPMVFFPTGYFDKKTLTNLGMNYYSFDANAAFTWLSAKGYEVSLNAGYMINTQNTATKYLSGSQFHLDWTAAYHHGRHLAVGAVGYVVAQTTPDSGRGAATGSFYSSGAGIGPIVSYTAPVLGKEVSFIAKWIYDLGGENRLKGNTLYGSLAVKF
ncbi:MAG: transporter, partial [Acidobacteriota bacterium]